MKRLFSFLLSAVMLFTVLLPSALAVEIGEANASADGAFTLNAKSWILVDLNTDEVLAPVSTTVKEHMAPASLTKIMTLLLLFEAVDRGEKSFDDVVTVSDKVAAMGGSTIYLTSGEEVTVDELTKGLVIQSGNDAAVAVAEYVSGSEADFVALMNQRAQELGMADTNFVNCHGLDEDGHYSCAFDVAIMSRELMKHQKILEYTAMSTATMRNGTFTMNSTNTFLHGATAYEGATGLKTGHTDAAGWCLSATVSRDGINLLAVVMGTDSKENRDQETAKLLDYAFEHYEILSDLGADEKLDRRAVSGGVSYDVQPQVIPGASKLVEKGRAADIQSSIIWGDKLKAPIKEGTVMGQIVYKLDGKEVTTVDIVAGEDVEKMTFRYAFQKLLRMFVMQT